MDISTTTNLYVVLAEIGVRRGESHARDLAVALKAVIMEGLATDEPDVIEAEFKYLLWGGSKSHREPAEEPQP